MEKKLDIRLLIRLLIQLIAVCSALFLLLYLLLAKGYIEILESRLPESVVEFLFPLLAVISTVFAILLTEHLLPLSCKICEVGKLLDKWTSDFSVIHRCNHCDANFRNFKHDDT